ncbi:hypothetical protein [Streptomyces xantholiticus]|uniref:hypothetical protein n=1 Tax=Streptomyces xantholiticus TaxID=68285 RepID=UPI001679A4DA|nr:hypothetical protein [Streptomyces xantholiticus]GGW71903.1 hypothetical protein GCM10010381_65790 [Streptomyces xantholiticus]
MLVMLVHPSAPMYADGRGPAPRPPARPHRARSRRRPPRPVAARLQASPEAAAAGQFSRVHNADRQIADHRRPVQYELPLPTPRATAPHRQDPYIHTKAQPRRREADAEHDGV